MLPAQLKKTNWLEYLKKPNFYFISATVVFLILLLAFILPKYNQLVALKQSIRELDIEIYGDPQNGTYLGKKAELKQVEMEYNDEKTTFDQLNTEKNEYLAEVFPAEADAKLKAITQILEVYSIEHNSEKYPFVLNSISFGKASKESKEPKPYQTVSINLPVEMSEKHFAEFVNFLNKSGSINPDDFYQKKYPVPLMTIESLSFTYKENPKYPNLQIITANFILNTYIRPTNSTENVSSTE